MKWMLPYRKLLGKVNYLRATAQLIEQVGVTHSPDTRANTILDQYSATSRVGVTLPTDGRIEVCNRENKRGTVKRKNALIDNGDYHERVEKKRRVEGAVMKNAALGYNGKRSENLARLEQLEAILLAAQVGDGGSVENLIDLCCPTLEHATKLALVGCTVANLRSNEKQIVVGVTRSNQGEWVLCLDTFTELTKDPPSDSSEMVPLSKVSCTLAIEAATPAYHAIFKALVTAEESKKSAADAVAAIANLLPNATVPTNNGTPQHSAPGSWDSITVESIVRIPKEQLKALLSDEPLSQNASVNALRSHVMSRVLARAQQWEELSTTTTHSICGISDYFERDLLIASCKASIATADTYNVKSLPLFEPSQFSQLDRKIRKTFDESDLGDYGILTSQDMREMCKEQFKPDKTVGVARKTKGKKHKECANVRNARSHAVSLFADKTFLRSRAVLYQTLYLLEDDYAKIISENQVAPTTPLPTRTATVPVVIPPPLPARWATLFAQNDALISDAQPHDPSHQPPP